jgi:hypothetical protein
MAFQRVPDWRRAVLVGMAFALTYLLCCYHGLFFSVLLLAAAPFLFGRRLRKFRFWALAAAAVVTAGLLVAPVVTTQLRVSKEGPRSYSIKWVTDLSAVPANYLRAPWRVWLPLPRPADDPDRYSWPLSPGTMKMGLAMVGLCWGSWTRRRRRAALFLGVMAVMAFLLSMGPHLHLGQWSPYQLLRDYYPGFSHVRNMFRFAFFFQWSVALLAAFGIQAMLLAITRRINGFAARWGAASLVLAAGLLVVFEVWPAPARLYHLPKPGSEVRWVGWVHDKVDVQEAIVFLPISDTRTAEALLPTGEKMFHQMWHRRPMANGYSAFQPREVVQLRKALRSFPSREAVAGLREAGIKFCALEQQVHSAAEGDEMRSLGFVRVFEDRDAGFEFWRVPEPPSQ